MDAPASKQGFSLVSAREAGTLQANIYKGSAQLAPKPRGDHCRSRSPCSPIAGSAGAARIASSRRRAMIAWRSGAGCLCRCGESRRAASGWDLSFALTAGHFLHAFAIPETHRRCQPEFSRDQDDEYASLHVLRSQPHEQGYGRRASDGTLSIF
jgi:hypothetical protein